MSHNKLLQPSHNIQQAPVYKTYTDKYLAKTTAVLLLIDKTKMSIKQLLLQNKSSKNSSIIKKEKHSHLSIIQKILHKMYVKFKLLNLNFSLENDFFSFEFLSVLLV